MESGGGEHDTESRSKKRKATEEAPMLLDDNDDLHVQEEEDDDYDDMDDDEEGVNPVELLGEYKHADGSLNIKRLFDSWQFRLSNPDETSKKPMKLTVPTTECQQPTCKRHVGTPMLQIFSVKLTKLPRSIAGSAGPIQIYGFMAVRDLKDPLRNYVFNRRRDDPDVIQDPRSDPFVYLSGPKRGVHMMALVLLEYDMEIKREYEDDLLLIKGVAKFSEHHSINEAGTYRIGGHRGAAMDVRRARLLKAVEATVQVWILERYEDLDQGIAGGAVDLSVSGFVSPIEDEIKLFRGIVQKPCALQWFVVAVPVTSSLVLHFRAPTSGAGGGGGGSSSSSDSVGEFTFTGTAHWSTFQRKDFDFATVMVKVTWSPMFQ